ncbi:MAG: hypothetical protein FD167_885 [bacterium]|nr:MAG: hypothetical protein FD167_885 [bacterium]
MSTKYRPEYSVSEYLDIDHMSDFRHEYLNGDIFAMTGGSISHIRIRENVAFSLYSQLLSKDCEVLSGDMRVKTEANFYTYPDLAVVCGKALVEKFEGKETLMNPKVIVEILSKSTRNYDKGSKFELYKHITSFDEYVLIDQYQPHVVVYTKQLDNNWIVTAENKTLDSEVTLSTINCVLALNHIYRKIEFQPKNN